MPAPWVVSIGFIYFRALKCSSAVSDSAGTQQVTDRQTDRQTYVHSHRRRPTVSN